MLEPFSHLFLLNLKNFQWEDILKGKTQYGFLTEGAAIRNAGTAQQKLIFSGPPLETVTKHLLN